MNNTLSKLKPKRHWLRLAILSLLSLLIVAIGAFTFWAYSGGSATSEALESLISNENVTVNHDDVITFMPTDKIATSGFIFYPGGRVDARAYAPAAQAIATMGHLVVIVPAPLRLAFFNINKGDTVRQHFPDITEWTVGGHSLGGVAAAIYADRNPDIGGLVLWASYPNSSLADRVDLKAVSIYGTNDGLLSAKDIGDFRDLLPAQTQFVAIEGGNHAQFGWYGPQNGDNVATISHDEQAAQVIAATLAVLK